MFLMRADPLRGQVGGRWALEIKSLLGAVNFGIEPIVLCHLGPKTKNSYCPSRWIVVALRPSTIFHKLLSTLLATLIISAISHSQQIPDGSHNLYFLIIPERRHTFANPWSLAYIGKQKKFVLPV
jgi:hypothetical protein